jgi:hypothetical protein
VPLALEDQAGGLLKCAIDSAADGLDRRSLDVDDPPGKLGNRFRHKYRWARQTLARGLDYQTPSLKIKPPLTRDALWIIASN